MYKRCKREVKILVKERKDAMNKDFGRKMLNDYNGNRKLFWKEVRKERNQCKNEHMKVMNANWQLCVKEEDKIKR